MSITSMRMLDNSSAEIRWRLTGKLGMLSVDVAGEQRCRRIVHLVAHKLEMLSVRVAGAQRCFCWALLMLGPCAVALVARCGRTIGVLQCHARAPARAMDACAQLLLPRNCAHLAAGTTEIVLNLLTGRIEKQKETWDLSKCSPPAAAAWNAARALWAAKQVGRQPG